MEHFEGLSNENQVRKRGLPVHGQPITSDGQPTVVDVLDIAAEIDDLNGWRDPDEPDRDNMVADASSAFSAVLSHCWVDTHGRTREPKAAMLRFCALSMLVKPDLFPKVSYGVMGRKIDCTKAALSKLAIEFSDRFGLHFRRSRRESAREKFRGVARKSWQARHIKRSCDRGA